MKKIIIGIMALVYLAVSSGIVMEIHHCMGKISGVELFATGNGKCGKCGMKEKKGCCENELKLYKLQDTHKSVTNTIEFNGREAIAATNVTPRYESALLLQKISSSFQYYSPPDGIQPSRCIRYCVFRI